MLLAILKWYAIGVLLMIVLVAVDFTLYLKRHKDMNFTSADVVKIILYSMFFHWGGVFFYIADFFTAILNRYMPQRKTKKRNNGRQQRKETWCQGL